MTDHKKLQARSRARVHAAQMARAFEKTTPEKANTVYTTRIVNRYGRKWLRKRGFLREDIAVTFGEALSKLPATWSESAGIVLDAGVYGVGLDRH